MVLRKLERRIYGRKWPVSIKYQNLHSFKEGLILLCQSIVEMRRITFTWLSSLYNPFNNTQRERLVFHSIQCRNGWLAVCDLFDMFMQSVKFYTFHYQYRCVKNVIHQIDSKNGWLLLLASFTAKFGLVCVLTLENALS